jgi:hypothetical protein
VVTENISLLSHYFPCLLENYIFLSPFHNRSSGQAQILSSRCIVCRLPESSNTYMWLRSTFLSYTTTFLTCKRTISSCLHATEEIVDGPKSYQVDVLCVDYPSHLTVTCGYEVLFLSYPTTFLACKRTISSCLHAIEEIVDGPKSYQVDVLCVDYPSHLKLHVVTKYFSLLSHYFPYFYEKYIILAPCHSRSSG